MHLPPDVSRIFLVAVLCDVKTDIKEYITLVVFLKFLRGYCLKGRYKKLLTQKHVRKQLKIMYD